MSVLHHHLSILFKEERELGTQTRLKSKQLQAGTFLELNFRRVFGNWVRVYMGFFFCPGVCKLAKHRVWEDELAAILVLLITWLTLAGVTLFSIKKDVVCSKDMQWFHTLNTVFECKVSYFKIWTFWTYLKSVPCVTCPWTKKWN